MGLFWICTLSSWIEPAVSWLRLHETRGPVWAAGCRDAMQQFLLSHKSPGEPSMQRGTQHDLQTCSFASTLQHSLLIIVAAEPTHATCSVLRMLQGSQQIQTDAAECWWDNLDAGKRLTRLRSLFPTVPPRVFIILNQIVIKVQNVTLLTVAHFLEFLCVEMFILSMWLFSTSRISNIKQTQSRDLTPLLISDGSHGPETALDSSSSKPAQAAEDGQPEPEPGAEWEHARAGARSQEDAGSQEQDQLLEAEECQHHRLRPAVQSHLPRQRPHWLGKRWAVLSCQFYNPWDRFKSFTASPMSPVARGDPLNTITPGSDLQEASVLIKTDRL